MIKLVAFDWNGTLFSDAQTVVDACNHFIKAMGGKPITLEIYRKQFVVPVIDFYESVGLDREKILANSHLNAEIFHKYYELKVQNLRSRAGAREVLSWLAKNNIQTVIISNHVAGRINEQLNRLKLLQYISKTIANDELDDALKGKNKGEKLKAFISAKKLKPKEVLIVGDSTEEIEIARDLRLISIAITHGHYATARLKAARPDRLINNLRDIIKIIKKLNKSKFEI